MEQLLKEQLESIDRDMFLKQWIAIDDERNFPFRKGLNSELRLHVQCKYKELLKVMLEKLADNVYNLPQGEVVSVAVDFIRKQIEKL